MISHLLALVAILARTDKHLGGGIASIFRMREFPTDLPTSLLSFPFPSLTFSLLSPSFLLPPASFSLLSLTLSLLSLSPPVPVNGSVSALDKPVSDESLLIFELLKLRC